jgi:hypothetical protein
MYLNKFKEFCKEVGDEHIGDVQSTELNCIYSIHKIGNFVRGNLFRISKFDRNSKEMINVYYQKELKIYFDISKDDKYDRIIKYIKSRFDD